MDEKDKRIEELHKKIGDLEAIIGACRDDGMSIKATGDGRTAINNVRAMRAEDQIERMKGAIENTVKRLRFIIYPGIPFNQRLAFEEMIDVLEGSLKEPV
jgi:phage shock protein A